MNNFETRPLVFSWTHHGGLTELLDRDICGDLNALKSRLGKNTFSKRNLLFNLTVSAINLLHTLVWSFLFQTRSRNIV